MQEKAYARVRQPLAQHARQQHELVVVHPDQIVRAGVLDHGVAEPAVGFDVGLPALGREAQTRRQVMKQRPDGLVRISFVEIGDQVRGQVDGDGAIALGPLLKDTLPFGIARMGSVAGPADPDTSGTAQDGVHSGSQSARAAAGDPLAVLETERLRQPVRNDYQPLTVR